MKFKLGPKEENGLHRIIALRDIPEIGVKVEDIGGFVEKEDNLSQEGNCWISDDALVYGNAQVFGNAQVSGDTLVYEAAQVFGNARVSGEAMISGTARVSGVSQVFGHAQVFGNAQVSGTAQVFGNARVSGDASVAGAARVSADARVSGMAELFGNARVSGDANIKGYSHIIRGKITKSSDCINISGFTYNLTFIPGYVRIGCEVNTYEQWINITKSQADKMGLKSKDEFNHIKLLIRFYQKQMERNKNQKDKKK